LLTITAIIYSSVNTEDEETAGTVVEGREPDIDRTRGPTGVAAEVVGMEKGRTCSVLSMPARSRSGENTAAAAAALVLT